MNKWQHFYNQLNKQNRIKFLLLMLDQLDKETHLSLVDEWLSRLLSLSRLVAIYLIAAVLIHSTLAHTMRITPPIEAIALGGSFAIALAIDSMIRSAVLIFRAVRKA